MTDKERADAELGDDWTIETLLRYASMYGVKKVVLILSGARISLETLEEALRGST